MTRPSRIAARVVAAVAWLGASLLVVDFPHARPVAAAASRLGLVSQTPYGAPADGAVTFVLSVPGNIDLAALPDATVVITAYRPVATRLDLDKVRAGTLPRIVDGVDFPAAALPRPAADQIGVVVTLETSTRSTGALQLANPGLYPVLVELQDNGTVLAELLTFVHRLPAADEPQEVALPVAVAMTTTSTVVIDDDNEVVVDSTIMKEFGLLADLLEASTVPISVRVPPALLFAIAQHGAAGAALADRLATGLARNEVLSSPRLPLDASQAAAAGQQSLYTQWLRDGEDDLTTFISNLSVGTVAFMDGPLTGAGGTMLRDLGARLIVTTPKIFDALPDTTGIYTDFSQLVNIEVSPGVNVDATVTDRRFATLLERRTTTPALTAVYAVTDLLAYRQEMVDADLDDEGNGVGDPSEHGVTLGTTDLSLPQIDTYRAIASLLAETPCGGIQVGERAPRPPAWANPVSSDGSTPRAAHQASNSRCTMIGARGSANVAVPTCTALAPASINSAASQPLATPPAPMIDRSGIAACTSYTVRTATAWIGRPLYPPPPAPSTGRPLPGSSTMPNSVFYSVTASTPASATAAATSTTRSVLGLSLAHRGRRQAAVAAITSADRAASCAKMPRRPSRFGHERLTSTATTHSGADDSCSAASW